MTHFDLIVRGGEVVTEAGTMRLDIGVVGEHIAVLEPELSGTYDAEIDATGNLVFPGVVDPHVHFNEPGRTDWEGWAMGSAALAAGGGTVCIEMPLNSHPPTLTHEAFDLKVTAATGQSHVDFALWGGLTPDNLDHLEDLAEAGVVGFKAFMSRSGTDDFQHADDETLFCGMQIAARLGLPVAVHAESDAITHVLAEQAIAAGRTTMRDYLDSRPIAAELEAIRRAIALAELAKVSLHIVHISNPLGFQDVVAAREQGLDITAETCPHYLVFSGDDAERIGPLAKCAPPLRSRKTVDGVWESIRSELVDMIGSDHSPAPLSMKQSDNAFANWGGISGCQHLLPVVMTEADRHEFGWADVARLTSATAAHRFGLADKGEIAVGKDADLAILRLQDPTPIPLSEILYRHPRSAWDEFPLTWRVTDTLLRGQPTVRDGKVVGPPRGRLLRPNR